MLVVWVKVLMVLMSVLVVWGEYVDGFDECVGGLW